MHDQHRPSKAKDLLEDTSPLQIHSTTRLENHGRKVVTRINKPRIVAIMFLCRRVIFTGNLLIHVTRRQWANHRHVNGQSLVELPQREGHIPRTSSTHVSGPNKPSFSISGFRRAISANLNSQFRTRLCLAIISPFSCSISVVAKFIHGLHAKRTGGVIFVIHRKA